MKKRTKILVGLNFLLLFILCFVGFHFLGRNNPVPNDLVVKNKPVDDYVTQWTIPTELEFEINLNEGHNFRILFQFQNTGTTTWVNANFTITLPEGWTAEVSSVMLPWLEPQGQTTIFFNVTAPESVDKFVEEPSILIEATILETGEPYQDEITVRVVGKKPNHVLIWALIVIASTGEITVFSSYFVKRRHEQEKEHKIKTLLRRVANEPREQVTIPEESRTHVADSASFDHLHERLCNLINQHELATEVVATNPDVSEAPCEVAPPPINFILLKAQVFNTILQLFPSLNPQFPLEDRTDVLLELNGLSLREFFAFTSTMIEKLPAPEIKTQICTLTNALIGSEKNPGWTPALNEIKQLILFADSIHDQTLLNNLLQLIILIKYS